MKLNTLVKAHFTVPIYDSVIWVVVAHDALKTLNRMAKRFNAERGDEKFSAMCVDDCVSTVGLFFYADCLTEDTLAHEISHAVDFVLRHISHTCTHCDEPRAYLNGYITKRVRAILRKRKISIKRS